MTAQCCPEKEQAVIAEVAWGKLNEDGTQIN